MSATTRIDVVLHFAVTLGLMSQVSYLVVLIAQNNYQSTQLFGKDLLAPLVITVVAFLLSLLVLFRAAHFNSREEQQLEAMERYSIESDDTVSGAPTPRGGYVSET